LSYARSCLLAALALVGVLMVVACGDTESPLPSRPTTTLKAELTPGPALTPIPTVSNGSSLLGYCNPPAIDTAPYQLEVKAEWQGKDRIVIEGSVVVSQPVSLQYVICQDGELSFSLVPARQPETEGGDIRAESNLVPSERGPAFNPDAKFEAVLFFLRQDLHTPLLIAKIPVEGRPE
jgi:hypothetical protein